MPPPSTVSIVRASRFGVSASKSCNEKPMLRTQATGAQLLPAATSRGGDC